MRTEHLNELKQLKELNLGGCKRVSSAGFKHLSSAVELELLNLSVTQVSDEALKVIGKLTKLRHLDLDNTNVTTMDWRN